MSASSFPLPPSFSSFPNIDPGPSNSTPSSARNGLHIHPHRSIDFNGRDRPGKRGHREKDGPTSRREKHFPSFNDWPSTEPRVVDTLSDDERLKANEDRPRLEQHAQERDRWVPRPLFYSDRKGDTLNMSYGSLHTGDVPKYRPVAHGKHILGLDKAWTVSYTGEGIQVTFGQRKQPSLTHPSSSALLGAPSRRLIASADNYKYKEVDGFLRLTSRTSKSIDHIYRPISRGGDASSDSELSMSDADGESSDDDQAPTLTSHQLAIKVLEDSLSADPSSVPTWLSLVAQSLSVVPLSTKNASKSRSEISLSILSRARAAHSSNLHSPVLLLKYLRAGEELWPQAKLTTEWEGALRLGGIDIWMEWLEWRIRTSAGGIDQVVCDAARALKALGSSEHSELDRLRIVWRVAIAFQEAGFHERATALFQAQAELTFEVPQSLYGLPVDIQLDALEEFWESEVPRVGEPNAKGWSAWVSSGKPKATLSSLLSSMDVDSTSADPFIRWYNDETQADVVSRIPARYELGVSDPYATVLLSDIKALLLPLATQRAKDVFRLIWLSVMGLHIPGLANSLADGSWDDRWSYTHLAVVSRLSSIFPPPGSARQVLADSHAGVLIGRERVYGSAFGPVKDWSLGALGPLEWVGKDCWKMWSTKDTQGVHEEFVKSIFSQLRCGVEDHQWDVYALAFEASVNIKSALKLSRTLLSHAPESLPHWAAHARLERMRGRIEDARKVYQSVLISTRHSPTQGFVGQMWWDWAELEWLNGDQDVALRVVMRSGNVDGTGGMMILRAKRNLEDIINVTHGLWKDREGWIKLRALIDLLTGSSLPAVLAIFDSQSAEIGQELRENLMVASLVMLYNYTIILRTPAPPAILRDRLQVAIGMYPSNTVVLGMFLEAEKGYGVWGRVRSQLGEGVGDGGGREKGISRRAAEVWVAGWERGRWEVEVERTRNGLVAAVENDRTRYSAIVWRIVLEFEIRTGQMERAKSLLYRAIGECPLSKGLYLLAFGPLRHVFTTRELTGFMDIMAERGLRVRRGLEEYGWSGEDARGEVKREESVDGEQDEIEAAAEERRRRLPY